MFERSRLRFRPKRFPNCDNRSEELPLVLKKKNEHFANLPKDPLNLWWFKRKRPLKGLALLGGVALLDLVRGSVEVF